MILSRLRHAAALGALAAAAVSCESGTDPEVQHLVDLVLDFCSDDVPVWMAYRNQGADWVRLTPNAEGTVTFTATNDVALAIVRQSGSDYATEIVLAANTELEGISGETCREDIGSNTVHGTLSGVVGSQVSQVAMLFSTAYLGAAQTSFSLQGVPNRPVDLVASRYNITATTQTADRVVIRRSESPAHNATIPVIDFAASTTLVPAAFGATLSGIGTGDHAFLQNYFVSQLGTVQLLANVEPAVNGSATMVALPQSALAAGDYHDLFLIASDGSGASRGVERYFRAAAPQALPLGPAMANPTITEAGTSPYLRMRTRLTRQAEYARAMTASFLQQQTFSVTRVDVTITSGYDASGTWDATMPDLSGVSGWQNAWGLVNGGPLVEWTVTAFGARPELLFGGAPSDGETVRFASRQSGTNVRIARATRSSLSARLPRSVGPFR